MKKNKSSIKYFLSSILFPVILSGSSILFSASAFAADNIFLESYRSGASINQLNMFNVNKVISNILPQYEKEKPVDESGSVHNLIKLYKNNYKSKQRALYLEKGGYNHYYGLIHSHTSYSDGSQTPEDAYRYARDQAGLDFFAVTDHSNLFDNEFDWEKSEEWAKTKAIADSFNVNNKFVTLVGFEMSWYNGNGHMNTINTEWFVSANDPKYDLPTYYKLISSDKNSFSQWNHPGNYFGHFRDFSYYSPEADNAIKLIEVGNGSGDTKGNVEYFRSYDFYYRALDKGWHVAPSINQDNHMVNWGTANDARTVVLAPRLNRKEVIDAIMNRRVYATEDKNLKMIFRVNNNIMGSILNNPSELDFFIQVTDSDPYDTISRIDIISEKGKVVKSNTFNSTTAKWSFKIKADYKYYYVRVTESDGDMAFSAPIWTGKK